MHLIDLCDTVFRLEVEVLQNVSNYPRVLGLLGKLAEILGMFCAYLVDTSDFDSHAYVSHTASLSSRAVSVTCL